MTIHVVQPGETIFSIAAAYGLPVNQIIADNGLSADTPLVIGQSLAMTFPSVVHTVLAGETLSSISQRYGVGLRQLLRNNPQLRGSQDVYPGQTLRIEFSSKPIREMAVNGYAYPFVNRELLQRTLPYLTYITFFTYGFHPDGTLIGIDDEELIALSRQAGVAPLMHFSSLTGQGTFSNELAHIALTDMQVQNTLIENILTTLQQKNYHGLDVDFEFISPDDSDAYVAFIQNLSDRLNPEGFEVITALVPKTSSTQRGMLYEGHNYAGLGAASNYVFLMTYEWGYTYGPPMAVAPIQSVENVLQFAITQVSPEKIFMGIPNYGYNWTLPFIRGESQAPSIGNQEAVEIAAAAGATIEYDQDAQSPFFTYWDSEGRQHEVWFEDARSIEAKLLLAAEFGFPGVGYWNLMRPFQQNWTVVNALYQVQDLL